MGARVLNSQKRRVSARAVSKKGHSGDLNFDHREQELDMEVTLGLYPIVSPESSSTALYKLSDHIQWLLFF
jgi:hypothetical protein